jgi:hypothetical protein
MSETTQVEPPISNGEVLRTIAKVQEYIASHQVSLPNELYSALDGLSQTMLVYLHSDKQPGWARTIQTSNGERMWSDTQASTLESVFPNIVQKLTTETQSGGEEPPVVTKTEANANADTKQREPSSAIGEAAKSIASAPVAVASMAGEIVSAVTSTPPPPLPLPGAPTLHLTPSSEFIQGPVASTFSIDAIFETIRNSLKSIDERNREIASIIGPVAMVKSLSGDPVLIPPIEQIGLTFPIKLPTHLIIPMINSILETCRLLVSSSMLNIEYLRKVFSIVLALFDISRGEWRDGVLSFMGYFGNETMLLGQSLKTARWVYNLISPDIQERLENDIYAGGKSLLVGFLLWFLNMVSPSYVRTTLNTLLESAQEKITNLKETVDGVYKTAQISAGKAGATIYIPKFPFEHFPSMIDIQNFQSIVHMPEVFCSEEFQTALAPAIQIAPLRLLIELLNIPTLPNKIINACHGQPASFKDAIAQNLQITSVINPPAPQLIGTQPTAPLSQTTNNQTANNQTTNNQTAKQNKKTRKNRNSNV